MATEVEISSPVVKPEFRSHNVGVADLQSDGRTSSTSSKTSKTSKGSSSMGTGNSTKNEVVYFSAEQLVTRLAGYAMDDKEGVNRERR